MDGSLVVAVAAAVISGVALVLSLRADRRAKKAEQREAQRFERERQAILHATYEGSSGVSYRGRYLSHIWNVRNVGLAPARNVRGWYANDEERELAEKSEPHPTLVPGETVELDVDRPDEDTFTGEWPDLRLSWEDDYGRHEELSAAMPEPVDSGPRPRGIF